MFNLDKVIIFDGGFGTLLQERGLKAGEFPEILNITSPQTIINIHEEYIKAGANIITTNSFGASRLKFKDTQYDFKDIIINAINNAKVARENLNSNCKIALDIGPLGKLLKPMGDLSFDDAYTYFKEMMIIGEQNGANLIIIETISDTYELKAAVLAAKENTNLPVFATVTFDENLKLLTGGDVPSVVALLEGLKVDALGVNCGTGPLQMRKIVQELLKFTSTPIIVNPNAGLPKEVDGKTVFDTSPEEFSNIMLDIVRDGACFVGGCCGTTPKHIELMYKKVKDIVPKKPEFKELTLISSYSKCVIADKPKIIGERINPTGKKLFKQALIDNNIEYILNEGFAQLEKGADILDVNVGLPDIDEVNTLYNTVIKLQSVIDLPLQIDTADVNALEKALRYYNGKPMINSVNGKKESLDKVLPLVKKYGGVLVCLTLDEKGIPDTAEGRYEIAKNIVNEALKYGIHTKDLVIDPLCMTISSDSGAAIKTLDSIKLIKQNLGVKTILGVSNISFGLPKRELINAHFYTLALNAGLDFGIINPLDNEILNSFYAFNALNEYDDNFENYIAKTTQKQFISTQNTEKNLKDAIICGLLELSATETYKMLDSGILPLDIINNYLMPALDIVGQGFEKGTLFLPQLLMSAEAAKKSFEIIKQKLLNKGETRKSQGKIILATVKGDIHDIGKNIVKVLLDNYNFDVIDLGKDVEPQLILDTAIKEDIKLVGLSALMTTTVVSMKETITLLQKYKPDCKIMVGGAVLTQDYADMIFADFYSKDALGSVNYAKDVFKNN